MNKRESRISIIATVGIFLFVFGIASFLLNNWRVGSVLVLFSLTFLLAAFGLKEEKPKRESWLLWAYVIIGGVATIDLIVQIIYLANKTKGG